MQQKKEVVTQKRIRLNAENVQEFVNAAVKCDFDIDVFCSRILIDAKSILGVLSMDLSKDLTVNCHGKSRDFDKTLAKFEVA